MAPKAVRRERRIMNDQPRLSIPSEHYRLLSDMAAGLAGRQAAGGLVNGFFHPGDVLGTILCEAWRIENWRASTAMVAYMSALRSACSRMEIDPPAFTEVLRLLPLAFNEGRYPDVDLDKLRRALAHDVPKMAGDPW